MDIRIEDNRYVLVDDSGKWMSIWFGWNEIFKTESEAAEFVEIIKDFFDKKDQKEVKECSDTKIVAELAVIIYANNTHNFDERRAVNAAVKIIKIAEELCTESE